MIKAFNLLANISEIESNGRMKQEKRGLSVFEAHAFRRG
jgi:hypothetical protein